MPFLCDAHVHIYSLFDLTKTIEVAAANLTQLATDQLNTSTVPKILCLTERFDCHYFETLSEHPAALPLSGITVSPTDDDTALRLHTANGTEVLLLAGRQIVTAERVELLSLCSNVIIPDRLPLDEAHQQIIASGGIPVLTWAPGKWLFKRQAIVSEFLSRTTPKTLAIGDTTLRPTIWSEPSIMKRARLSGYSILAGSDPLPFSGEDVRIGTYAVGYHGMFDVKKPASEFKRVVFGDSANLKILGRRGGITTVFERLNTHRTAGKSHVDSLTQTTKANTHGLSYNSFNLAL